MDILLLRTFLSIAETGSFSAASLDLHCVQSNVTNRIRRLEDHLGNSVFERGKGGARLTEFGKHLRFHAEDLLRRFDAAERDLLDIAGASAPINIGAMETTAAVRLPLILKTLKQSCPTAPISLRTAPTGDVTAHLWDRRIDAGFVAGPIDLDRFQGIPAFTEQLVVVENKSASGQEPLLAFRSGCCYRAQAEMWLRDDGKGDREIVEMGSMEGILGCIVAGMGFAVAPKSSVDVYRDAGDLKISPLPATFSEIEIYLIWRLDHRPTNAHRTLIELIKNLALGV